MQSKHAITPVVLVVMALPATMAFAQFQVTGSGQVDATSFAGDGAGLTNLDASQLVGGPVLVEVLGPADLRGVVAPTEFRAQTAFHTWDADQAKEIELTDLQGAALRQLVVGQIGGQSPGACVVRVEAFTDPFDETTDFDVGTYTLDAEATGSQQLLLPAVQATGYRLHLSTPGPDTSCSAYVGVNGVTAPTQ